VDRAVQRVWLDDPDAAAHRARVVKAKLASTRRLASWLVEEGQLAPGWTMDSASDMLFALIASDVIEALIVDRRWSRTRLAEHLALVFRSTFVAHEMGGAQGSGDEFGRVPRSQAPELQKKLEKGP
jgi:hypothetical protein